MWFALIPYSIRLLEFAKNTLYTSATLWIPSFMRLILIITWNIVHTHISLLGILLYYIGTHLYLSFWLEIFHNIWCYCWRYFNCCCYYVQRIPVSHWDDAYSAYGRWFNSTNQFSSYHIIYYAARNGPMSVIFFFLSFHFFALLLSANPTKMDTHGSACIHNHKVIPFDLCVLYIDDVSVYDFIMDIFMKMAKLFASNRIDGTNAFDEHKSDFRHFLIKADYKKNPSKEKKKNIETTTLICILAQNL